MHSPMAFFPLLHLPNSSFSSISKDTLEVVVVFTRQQYEFMHSEPEGHSPAKQAGSTENEAI